MVGIHSKPDKTYIIRNVLPKTFFKKSKKSVIMRQKRKKFVCQLAPYTFQNYVSCIDFFLA